MNATQARPVGVEIDDILRSWGVDPTAAPSNVLSEKALEGVNREILTRDRAKWFEERCPEEFKGAFVPERSRAPHVALQQAMLWRGAFPGVWLWSNATGQGKTRMMWTLVRVARVDLGRSILEYTGQQWADEFWRHHMDGKADELWGWLKRWDVLVLDDVDKINVGDVRQQRALREFFDVIYRERKPAIVTANKPPSWIAETLGQSAERRVAESFTAIRFE